MSNERRRLCENNEPWEKDVPADLIPAIEHLRDSFEKLHWGCGQSTQKYCYSSLHNEPADDPDKEYLKYLFHLKARLGPGSRKRFDDLVRQQTLPAVFKAFYDLYLEAVNAQVLVTFKELTEIGRAHEARLDMPHLEWAAAQTSHLIRSHTHTIRMWIKEVCDKHVYDPNEDPDEMVFWRKWQAPRFLIMKPSRFQPYDAATVWERTDPATSSRWLDSFAEDYVSHLEAKVKRAAGDAALALAKQPRQKQTRAEEGNLKVQGDPTSAATTPQVEDPATNGDNRGKPIKIRREARKLDTQSMYANWQKEYRRLRRSHPGESDVWYARQIAGKPMGKGRSPDTIRKHMTK